MYVFHFSTSIFILIYYSFINEFFSLYFQTEEEAGLLEQVKSQICDNIAMYAQKYDEEFAPHLPSFVTAVWNLLTTTGAEVKYDLVCLGTIIMI